MTRVPPRICVGVLLIALATLLFEVCLTRTFSVTLWYHFGFLAIALAMLGGTAAAVACHVLGDRLTGDGFAVRLGWFAMVFAAAAPAAMWLHFHAPLDAYAVGGEKFFAATGIQLLGFFLVFFSGGMCITIALTRFAVRLGTVYFFDLVGAAAGAVLFVPLLAWFSAPALVFAASLAGGAAALLFLGRRAGWVIRPAAALVTAGAAVLLCVNDSLGVLEVSRIKAYRGATMQEEERGRIYEKWSPVARVAVFEPRLSAEGQEMMRLTNDGGAPTNLHKFDGDVAKLADLRGEARQIAHHLKPGADVLIIGSAGGRDVRSALAFDQQSITAVEINPVTVELVRERYADYIGRLFEHPRVTLHQAEGRNFLTASQARYDLIQVSMIDSWAGSTAGAYVFNESNLYTTDAVADYLAHLKPDGVLSITRYYRSHEAIRLANVILAHLEHRGVPDPHRRLVVVQEQASKRRGTLLLKNGTFGPGDAPALLAAARASHNDLVYAPHVAEEDLVRDEYARVFRSLIHPQRYGATSRAAVVRAFPLDISPVSDDRPFFFFMDRPRSALLMGGDGPAARRMALPLLYGVFGFLALVCVLTVILPLALSRRSGLRGMPYRWRGMAYFGCLGVGFMLIELGLIHRFTVLLGYPAYSFITVVTTLLLAGGIGSWLSGHPTIHGRRRVLCLALAAVAVAISAIALEPEHVHALRALPAAWRTACVAGLIAPLGLAMGMCFPLGMDVLRRLHPGIVAWGWGVNGACGVFGCAATLVIALNFGLTACLLTGGACYLVALACVATVRVPGA
jgi:hypothetical protein